MAERRTKATNRAPVGAILGDDGLRRCAWAATNPVSRAYHDTEWGVPIHGEGALLERICLEGFQSGLSWLTILNKRPAFRAAFHDFDADVVAALTDQDVDRLMLDTGIVRSRANILAARANARATLTMRGDGGLDTLVWSFRPARRAVRAPRTPADVPTQSPASVTLSAELRRRGFAFVGPTTMHALMEAIGMVNTHLVGCHRRHSDRRRPPLARAPAAQRPPLVE